MALPENRNILSDLSAGNVPLVCLAPMAGATDHAMRRMCKAHGAAYMTTEMVSAQAVRFADKKTLIIADIAAGEMPAAVQIFGEDPAVMAYAAEKLLYELPVTPAAIDINMGCPVKKIVSVGAGSALMKNTPLAAKIVEEVVKASRVPVTVKIRAGFTEEEKNAPEFARAMQESGASLITVHGRTRAQQYMPGVDYEIIRRVKETVTVPVIANGDIDSGEKAKEVLSYTGCDGVAVGRGALGRPFVFAEINAALKGEVYTPPGPSERLDAAITHIRLLIKEKGEYIGAREARKHAAWYTKGIYGSAELRVKINRCETQEEIEELFREFRLAAETGNIHD